MLTYSLFKTKSMLLSATSMECLPDADLQPVQNPEHLLVSNKQEGTVRCWLTYCSKPRASSCQQQAEKACQMLTYILFKTQSMLLSVTSRRLSRCWLTSCSKSRACSCQQQGESQPVADLHTVQNPEHALVSNKQGRLAKCWLTSCSKPRACSCQ